LSRKTLRHLFVG